MSRSVAIIIVLGVIAATGVLLLLFEAVDLGALTSPSAGLIAVMLGVLAGLLTTFTGCTSVPTRAGLEEAKDQILAARERYGREKLSIQLKLEDMERLVGNIEDETDKRLGFLRADRVKINGWVKAIDGRKKEIEAEHERQARTVDALIETAEAMIAKAQGVRARAQEQLQQSNVEPTSGGDEPRHVLGWTKYIEEATAVVERAKTRLEHKRLEREWLRRHGQGTKLGLERLDDLLTAVARFPTASRTEELGELVRALAGDHADLLHVGFGDGWEDVLAVADFFTAYEGPTLVLRPDGETSDGKVHLTAKIRLDEGSVGTFTTGDVLVLSLPEGVALGAPVGVEAPAGMELKVRGNAAGSRAVTLEIRADAGVSPRAVSVVVDQELTVEPGTGVGWAWVWSSSRNTGVTLPVLVLPG